MLPIPGFRARADGILQILGRAALPLGLLAVGRRPRLRRRRRQRARRAGFNGRQTAAVARLRPGRAEQPGDRRHLRHRPADPRSGALFGLDLRLRPAVARGRQDNRRHDRRADRGQHRHPAALAVDYVRIAVEPAERRRAVPCGPPPKSGCRRAAGYGANALFSADETGSCRDPSPAPFCARCPA